MTREYPPLRLRVERDLKIRITEAAYSNGRSVSAEVASRLESTFLRDTTIGEINRKLDLLLEINGEAKPESP
ncbi:Arc family DNA-binding protein [Marinobacterium jannaschii]|uniref:Arc family DNA-binding protein n=1 Tax=Marinobacterium jannaschii TaxID=64970 RepID=UPI00056659F2|nr:Arc family DNA-binding protein [Marinobacterium jannaschii]